MPWVLLARWVARIVAGLVFWRVASARRRAPRPRINRASAAASIREGASLGWRGLSLAAFLIAAAVLITAGLTTAVLSPRWLGAVLLALAALALVSAALELRALLRILSARRRRRHDRDLRGQLS